MRRSLSVLASAVAIVIALLTITSCGASSQPQNVVRFAGPSHDTIDRSTLNHWMEAMAGEDIRHNLGTEGPKGLASEPADPQRCFAAAKLVAPRSFFNQIRYDRVQVTEKCRQLHEAIKAQALDFLIAAHWTVTDSAERGITASQADVEAALMRERKRLYPTRAALHRYLAERHWSLSDLLYQLKLDLLSSRLGERDAGQATANGVAREARPRPTAAARSPENAIRTMCSPGYVVSGCSGYDGRSRAAPSADSIVEQLTGKRPETSAPAHRSFA